jgi:hypothetical protein
MYWLFRRKSKLSTSNKFLIYKTILKLNEIELWGMASTSNIEILQSFQPKALRTIVDAPWCMPNTVIRRDLITSTVKEEICHYSSQYSPHLNTHPNNLALNIMEQPDNNRLLQRHLPNDLPTIFLVSCTCSSSF